MDKNKLEISYIFPVTSEGRYYADEAKVPRTDAADLDEGHVDL